jgi:ribose 5-phosphate isomerase A
MDARARERARASAADAAATLVAPGMMVGLGTGRAAALAVRAIGRRIRAGTLTGVLGVPTSRATEDLAREVGIDLADPVEGPRPDLVIDGADEVDPALDLVKGAGGALLREKVVAEASARRVIVLEADKRVRRLGARAPIPVEVVPAVEGWVRARLEDLGGQVVLRRSEGETVRSDNGLHLLDVRFPGGLADPRRVADRLRSIPGVVEHGLFLDLADEVLVGHEDGSVERLGRA